MLFYSVYLIMGMLSAVYAAPFSVATGDVDVLDSRALSSSGAGLGNMHLTVRSQGSSDPRPATHVNGNVHHAHVNGNTASGGLAHFEVWFSNTKPSHPSTPPFIPSNIITEVKDTLANVEGCQVDVIFLESCSADTEAFWYEKLGSHDGALYTQLAP
ncbi:MAG: hypothetical protein NXY57DRAFT_263943 [Lentinula lateritia]|nr:MAG: hypothetical protein NXY57DRAFT_263943 [Lentinula lateritia]